jgi:proteasome lid subunit RPN8/RPN11
MLTEELKKRIKIHALSKQTEEVCGVIVRDDRIIECQNSSEDKANSFLILPEDINRINNDMEIVGFYHSHIGNHEMEFSMADKVVSEKTNLPSILYYLPSDSFLVYEPMGYEAPYVNRPNLLGVLDCLTLVQDFFKREFNIIIKDPEHPIRFSSEIWHESNLNYKNNNTFADFFKSFGFREVSDLKQNDLILMSYGRIKCPIHCAIYLGNNIILHHPPLKESLTEHYQEIYKKRTLFKFRHERF